MGGAVIRLNVKTLESDFELPATSVENFEARLLQDSRKSKYQNCQNYYYVMSITKKSPDRAMIGRKGMKTGVFLVEEPFGDRSPAFCKRGAGA
jgi:hypothetical protein